MRRLGSLCAVSRYLAEQKWTADCLGRMTPELPAWKPATSLGAPMLYRSAHQLLFSLTRSVVLALGGTTRKKRITYSVYWVLLSRSSHTAAFNHAIILRFANTHTWRDR